MATSQTLSPVDHVVEPNARTAIDQLGIVMTNAGIAAGGAISGTTVDNTVIGGTTPAAGTFTTVTGNTSVTSPSVVAGAAARKLTVSGASGIITEVASGTDSAIDVSLQPKGTGVVALGGTTTANSSMQVATVTSAVDFLSVSGSAAGTPGIVTATATGTDSNVSLALLPKGTGGVYMGSATLANAGMQVASPAGTIVNQLVVTPAITGTPVTLATGGASADANRDLYLAGNGTGAARLKGGAGAVAAPSGYVGEMFGGAVKGTAATATVTITSANPGVITWTSHGFSSSVYQPVVFTTTGGLPTNITSGTVYYATPIDANTFHISTTIANAVAGTWIDCTAGAQSGTQTGTAGCAMASTTAINVTGMSLPAGDWDLYAQVTWNAGSTTTYTIAKTSISQTTATLFGPGLFSGGCEDDYLATTQTATNGLPTRTLPMCTINVSTATTIFLVVNATFATSTLGAYGYLVARRRA